MARFRRSLTTLLFDGTRCNFGEFRQLLGNSPVLQGRIGRTVKEESWYTCAKPCVAIQPTWRAGSALPVATRGTLRIANTNHQL